MRARGAALRQLGWLVLRASVVIAVAAGQRPRRSPSG